MRHTEIKCDTCQIELNESGPMPSFRLRVICESIPNTTGFSYAVLINPPMTRDADFCSIACLSEWAINHPSHFKKKAAA